MNIMHPEDQQLQRYLNNHCTELEHKRITRHLTKCVNCRKRYDDFAELDTILDQLPLLEAPEHLTDTIMRQVYVKPWERENPAEGRPALKSWWRPELMNGLIAVTATFVLIMTGIPRKLMHLDAQRLESGVELTVMQVSEFIVNMSQQLLT